MTKLDEYKGTCERWCDTWSCDSLGERSSGCRYMPSCITYGSGFVEIDCDQCDWFVLCENKLKYYFMLDGLLRFLEDNYLHMDEKMQKKYKEITFYVEDDWQIDKYDEKPPKWDMWWKTIYEVIKENGDKIRVGEFICDYGSYDDAYEIGRVIQYGVNHGEFAWTKDGELYIHGYPPEDKKQS